MLRAPTKKFAIVFTIIFIAEFLIMFAIGHHRDDNLWENLKIMLIDTISLSFIAAPVLYFFLVKPLEDSLNEIKVLKGLMSVCCVCKKVQAGDDSSNKDNWVGIDWYIQNNSDLLFSHGYCPDCSKKVVENIKDFKDRKSQNNPQGIDPDLPRA